MSDWEGLEFLRQFEIDESADNIVGRFIRVILEGRGDERRTVVGDVVHADGHPSAVIPLLRGSELVGKLHINRVPATDRPIAAIDGEAAAAGGLDAGDVAGVDVVSKVVD